ncbi:hypothetical protein Scep_018185 [Stephania cephalantha]|uniref:FCP1 homology domain-containing protein n=1 Tax=Stephania cephalantha TaxID=152367 RepID=A0AAP0ISV1_9MAGN
MQTKKKIAARTSREHICPRACRSQKKATQNFQSAEKKATDLIASSPRKPRFTGITLTPKPSKDNTAPKKLSHTCVVASDDVQDICLEFGGDDGTFLDSKHVCDEGTSPCLVETIFSPGFHISKDSGPGIPHTVEFIEFFGGENDQVLVDNGVAGLEFDTSIDLILQDTSSIEKDEEGKASFQSTTITCPSNMDVDSDISHDQSDALVLKSCGMLSCTSVATPSFDEHVNGVSLSSDLSVVYHSMQNSKLECVDEQSQDSLSNEVYLETEDGEEIDYFDPYLFIKTLPDLSSIVPTFRPVLLPKQTRRCPSTTLVLDLDETLVHSTLEPCDDADFTFPVNFNLMNHTVYVKCRPHLNDFLEKVANLFEIIIFTASQSIYAEQLLNVLDPKRRIFRHRVYRDSCVFVNGNYLKDLSVLGRDLSRVIIIDNSPQAFGFQVDNGIPIESWFDDRTDKELLSLLPFLETLVGVGDVRPLIEKKFNIREKVARAVYPSAKL